MLSFPKYTLIQLSSPAILPSLCLEEWPNPFSQKVNLKVWKKRPVNLQKSAVLLRKEHIFRAFCYTWFLLKSLSVYSAILTSAVANLLTALFGVYKIWVKIFSSLQKTSILDSFLLTPVHPILRYFLASYLPFVSNPPATADLHICPKQWILLDVNESRALNL